MLHCSLHLHRCIVHPSVLLMSSFRTLQTVSVIGAGLMGSGIAQVSAQSGFNVHLIDTDDSQLRKAVENIQKNLMRIGKKKFADEKSLNLFVSDCLTKISISTELVQPIEKSDLVIEAIVEDLPTKHKLFRQLDEIAPTDCIFATNTSSLSLQSISQSISRRDQFGGLHFFNPVPLMKLVEVIRTELTSENTFQILMKFAASLGKTTVVCKDTPGFIVNRLLVPYLAEAVRLVEQTGVNFKDVDTAMKLGAGHPMGPFELADLVGLDTLKFILESFAAQCPGDVLFRSSDLLNHLVSQGKLGRKTGEGFFKYDSVGKMII